MLKKIKEILANWIFKGELDQFRASYEAKIKEIDLALTRAKTLKIGDYYGLGGHEVKYEKPQYTVLEPYNCDDIQYLQRLHEIITDDKFLFHLYVIKSEIVSKITSGNEKDAVYYQGMLKGLNEVFEKTLNASRAYKQLLQNQEMATDEQV